MGINPTHRFGDSLDRIPLSLTLTVELTARLSYCRSVYLVD